jgi:hypothetical protein
MSEQHNSTGPSVRVDDDVIVIEPGSAAWSILKLAVENDQKVSLQPWKDGMFKIKRGEYTWTLPILGTISQ